jgi:hypothetical protein
MDRGAPRTPRFNMPFELGLAVAIEKASKSRTRGWFVCESQSYRLAKSLSDLNGTDPFIHDGTIEGVFRELGNMFRRPGRQPSVQQMRTIYGVNPLDGTNYLDTASAFLKAFLHLLAGEGSGEGDGI